MPQNGVRKGEHIGWKVVIEEGGINPFVMTCFDENGMGALLKPFINNKIQFFLVVTFPDQLYTEVEWNGFKLFEEDNSIWEIPCTKCGKLIYIFCEPDPDGRFVCDICAGTNGEEVIVIS